MVAKIVAGQARQLPAPPRPAGEAGRAGKMAKERAVKCIVQLYLLEVGICSSACSRKHSHNVATLFPAQEKVNAIKPDRWLTF